MSFEALKEGLVIKFSSDGEDKFYRFLTVLGVQKLIEIENGLHKGIPPHLEYLDCHDRFIVLYRREGDEIYLRIAKTLRKAAHKIYRVMLKKHMTNPNSKFLTLV